MDSGKKEERSDSSIDKSLKDKKRSISSSDISDNEDDLKKHKKRLKKEKKLKKKHKKERKKAKKEKKKKAKHSCKEMSIDKIEPQPAKEPFKIKGAMTKEEWEKQESTIRRVYDSPSGRHRLVKGSGEILEECVSHDRHKEICKQATVSDGMYFQENVKSKLSKQ